MTVVMTQSELCAGQYIKLEKPTEDIQTNFLSSFYTRISFTFTLTLNRSIIMPSQEEFKAQNVSYHALASYNMGITLTHQ